MTSESKKLYRIRQSWTGTVNARPELKVQFAAHPDDNISVEDVQRISERISEAGEWDEEELWWVAPTTIPRADIFGHPNYLDDDDEDGVEDLAPDEWWEDGVTQSVYTMTEREEELAHHSGKIVTYIVFRDDDGRLGWDKIKTRPPEGSQCYSTTYDYPARIKAKWFRTVWVQAMTANEAVERCLADKTPWQIETRPDGKQRCKVVSCDYVWSASGWEIEPTEWSVI